MRRCSLRSAWLFILYAVLHVEIVLATITEAALLEQLVRRDPIVGEPYIVSI